MFETLRFRKNLKPMERSSPSYGNIVYIHRIPSNFDEPLNYLPFCRRQFPIKYHVQNIMYFMYIPFIFYYMNLLLEILPKNYTIYTATVTIHNC